MTAHASPPLPPPKPSWFAGVATIDEQSFADRLGMGLEEVREHLAGLAELGWLRRLPAAPDGSSSWALVFRDDYEDDGQ